MKFSQLRPVNESAVIADHIASQNNMHCMDGIEAALDAVENNRDISYELNDGNTVTISPQVGAEILATYDELNETNADIMNVLLKDSEESFIAAALFCEEFVKEYLESEETSENTKPVKTIFTAFKTRADRLNARGYNVKAAPHRNRDEQDRMMNNVKKAGGLANKIANRSTTNEEMNTKINQVAKFRAKLEKMGIPQKVPHVVDSDTQAKMQKNAAAAGGLASKLLAKQQKDS